jgi:hypothetical protein
MKLYGRLSICNCSAAQSGMRSRGEREKHDAGYLLPLQLTCKGCHA